MAVTDRLALAINVVAAAVVVWGVVQALARLLHATIKRRATHCREA